MDEGELSHQFNHVVLKDKVVVFLFRELSFCQRYLNIQVFLLVVLVFDHPESLGIYRVQSIPLKFLIFILLQHLRQTPFQSLLFVLEFLHSLLLSPLPLLVLLSEGSLRLFFESQFFVCLLYLEFEKRVF